MTTLQSSLPRRLDSILNLSKQDQAVAAGFALILVAATYYATKPSANKKLAPFVSREAVFGGTSFIEDPRRWVEQAAAANGGVFRTDALGRTSTIVGKDLAREVLLSEHFSLPAATEDVIDIMPMIGIKDKWRYAQDAGFLVTKHLTPNLKNYTKRVIEQLNIVLDRDIGNLEEPKILPHLFLFLQGMVAKASSNVFIGEELCQNDSIVNSFGSVTMDIGSNLSRNWFVTKFPTVNTWYQRYIFPHKKQVQYHRRNAQQHIAPEIERRVREAQNPDWKRPDDMMQKIMDTYSPTENYGIPYTELIINWLFLLVFASIHTTTENATMVMYWLLKHPQYTQELLQEQEEVVGSRGANGENLVLTFDDLKKLVKLDSFIREVLRLRTVDLALHHKNISGREVELSDGTCVPAGELVYVNSWDISRNVALQGQDAEEFRPWRYVETNKQAVKIGEDHITFGIGKHACPGRFFAVQEIKTIVSLLLSKYKMTAVTDVTLPALQRGMPTGAVKFERR